MGKDCFYMRLLRLFIPRNDKCKIPQSVIANTAWQSLSWSLRAQRGNLATNSIKKRPERFGSLFFILGQFLTRFTHTFSTSFSLTSDQTLSHVIQLWTSSSLPAKRVPHTGQRLSKILCEPTNTIVRERTKSSDTRQLKSPLFAKFNTPSLFARCRYRPRGTHGRSKKATRIRAHQ